jgi:hypothetical protein
MPPSERLCLWKVLLGFVLDVAVFQVVCSCSVKNGILAFGLARGFRFIRTVKDGQHLNV